MSVDSLDIRVVATVEVDGQLHAGSCDLPIADREFSLAMLKCLADSAWYAPETKGRPVHMVSIQTDPRSVLAAQPGHYEWAPRFLESIEHAEGLR